MQGVREAVKIPLEDFPSNPVFIGERSRLGTATSVSILDENHLACAHFSAKKIYLFRFDLSSGGHELLWQAHTTYDGRPCTTDLMTCDRQGRIAVSNFFEKTCTIYGYGENGIEWMQYLPYLCGDVVHGVKFYNDRIMAMTSRRGSSGANFFEIESGTHLFNMDFGRHSVQDICFLDDSHLVMVSTSKSPSLTATEMWTSTVDLAQFDFKSKTFNLIKSIEIADSHLDNIVYDGSHVYTTNQYQNSVLVMDPQSLAIVNEYTGFDFPHGIDVYNGLVSVSNYGSNTIEVFRM